MKVTAEIKFNDDIPKKEREEVIKVLSEFCNKALMNLMLANHVSSGKSGWPNFCAIENRIIDGHKVVAKTKRMKLHRDNIMEVEK